MKNSVKNFGIINSIEGYSYLVLLFIAMPMKYMLGYAIATRIAGSIHGALFIAFIFLFIKAWQDAKWPLKDSITFFVASLIPFGTFFTKKKIRSYQ
jgi:integral membrane protein